MQYVTDYVHITPATLISLLTNSVQQHSKHKHHARLQNDLLPASLNSASLPHLSSALHAAEAASRSGVALRLRGDPPLEGLLLRLPRLSRLPLRRLSSPASPLPGLSLSALRPRPSLPAAAAGDGLRLLLRPRAGLTKSSAPPALPAGLLARRPSSAGGPGRALAGSGLALPLPLLRLR